MTNSFIGFNEQVVTFQYEGVLEPGMLVTMYSSGTVRQASESETFIGKVIEVNPEFAAVQIVGYIECEPCKEIGVGRTRLVSDGYDRVSESYDGLDVWVVFSEETDDGYVVGFML